MKTYAELAAEIGELVERKNAAYGNSVEASGEFLALLYKEGLQPDQYAHALLLVRIFDKLKRIATDADALGESPYEDIAGYGILGAHMQWQQKEDRATWRGNANGPDAPSSAKEQPGSIAPSTSAKTTTSASATIAPEPSPQPDGYSVEPASAAAPTAKASANPNADGGPSHKAAEINCYTLICKCGHSLINHTVSGRCIAAYCECSTFVEKECR